MKALVTGGCGFLGSHVCETFLNEGWDVVAYDNMTKHELRRTGYGTEEVRDYNAVFLRGIGVEVVEADIRNREELLDHATGCQFIAHTAAQPAMTISWEDPELDFTTNVLGTYNVLMAAREHRVAVVSCSTVHVYGPWINDRLSEAKTRFLRDPVTISEDDKIMDGGKKGKISPLHASKASSEHYVKTFADMFDVKAASFRYTGIYGTRQFGGEDHGWVANFAIRSFLGWPLTLYGTGKQVRDILYASDAASAFLSYQRNPLPGIYNIGGGPKHMVSLLECIELIDKLTGRKSKVEFGAQREGDLSYFVCDIEKAHNTLSWQPKVLPKEGIATLISWIEKNANLFADSS